MKKLVISSTKGNRFEWGMVDLVQKEETASLFQKEYVPKAKDRLYIFPNCTIPRFKLKALCDKYDLAMSKTREKANVLVGNATMKDMEKEFFTGEHYSHGAFKPQFLNYLRKLPVMIAGELITAIENLTDDIVILGRDATNHLKDHGINGIKYVLYDSTDEAQGKCKASDINSDDDYWYTRRYISPDAQAIFESWVATGLYSQDAILKIINQNAPVIDEAMYQSLRSMFDGSTADQQIAMEAMANADSQRSMPYLLLLYKEFGKEALYNHPAKHHVNFKSLTNYLFGSIRSIHNITIDDCVEILRDKNLLNSKNMAVLMTEAKGIVKESGETAHFMVTDVVPSEEIQKIITDTDIAEAPIVSPIAAL
jgi:hypothetical protein